MFASVPSATLLGAEGHPVTVEVHVGGGLPVFQIVGLPDESCREARDQGLLVAFEKFQGSGGQVLHLDSMAPDYLLLCDSMLKDLASSRQPLRRLESVRAACDQLEIKPVLPQTTCPQTIDQCREVGYDLRLRGMLQGQELVGARPCAAC